ncbi:MAG: hypothetical protein NTV31_04945 [Bacteroidia bacterium]|nr:hypothetical protein [Bacteroidia bacterium]
MVDVKSLNIYEKFTVLLQLRHITGLKQGYLQPAMTPEEFEAWWRDQDTVNIFFVFDNLYLPGNVFYISNNEEFDKLSQIVDEERHWRVNIEMDKNSYLWKPDGTYVYHKGKKESDNSQYEVSGKLNVLLDEEFGYHIWIWQPDMDAEQLEEWWKNMETVMRYFFNPTNLPGEMLLVRTDDQVEQYEQMQKQGIHYSGHIHTDDDSYLKSPDGRTIHHKGYRRIEIDPETKIYL